MPIETFPAVTHDLADRKPVLIELDPFQGEKRLLLSIELSAPIRGISCYLRHPDQAYTVPAYLSSFNQIPPLSYFLLIEHDGYYTTLLPLSHSGVQVELEGSEEGPLLIARSATLTERRAVALLMRGEEISSTLHLMMAEALRLTGNLGKLRLDKPPFPIWLERLGWESGLAFGHEVSHDCILEAVASFQEKGIRLGYVLIDEGWQELASDGTLNGFGAHVSRFPKGLKGTTSALSKLGIRKVGVWHSLMGGRNGVHAELAAQYELPSGPLGTHYLGSHLGHTFQFFFDYYEALRNAGITFVKVGHQEAAHQLCPKGCDLTHIYRNLQVALQAASSIQFNIPHFNADCLRNENLFYWSGSLIARAGRNLDLTDPHNVYRALRNHLTNSLWLSQLMHPDFDTWATEAATGETLAVFHSLAGSMNAVSDRPYQQQIPLLKKMVLPSGKLLLADQPLTLCKRSIFIDPFEEREIYTTYTHVRECGVIGAFNLFKERRKVSGEIAAEDVGGLRGELFALHSYRSGFLGVVYREEQVSVSVKPDQPDILTFAPIRQDIALIGCHLFYLGCAIVLEVQRDEEAIHISSRVAGPILLYCTREVLEVRRNGHVVPWDQNLETGFLILDSRAGPVELDCLYVVAFAS